MSKFPWWRQVGEKLSALDKLGVINLPQTATQALALMVARNMQLQYTIQDGQVWMANDRDSVEIELQTMLGSAAG